MLTILAAIYIGGIVAKTPEIVAMIAAGHYGIAALESLGWPAVLVMHAAGLASIETDIDTRN